MTSTDLVKLDEALSKVSNGHNTNEDSWMTMWCNTNWGELLQPAPLAIALLSGLVIMASAVDDFSLDAATEGKVDLTYTERNRDSFKACLQQMAGAGIEAFLTAAVSMERIRNASGELPGAITNAIGTLLSEDDTVVENIFPADLDAIHGHTRVCLDASKEAEKEFQKASGIAQEILESATRQIKTDEERKAVASEHVTVLQQQEEQQKKMVEDAQKTYAMMKNSFAKAEDQFKGAVDHMPSGWEIVGMHVVESLTNTLTSALNAHLGTANTHSQYLQGGGSAVGGSEGKNNSSQRGTDVERLETRVENSTLPSGETLTDPGTSLADTSLTLVRALKLLISPQTNGKPDWETIRDSNGKSGALFVEFSLEALKDRLDDTKPISKQLLEIGDGASKIAKQVYEIAKSQESANPDVLDKFKPDVEEMIRKLESIVTRSNLILQQTGSPAKSLNTPVPQSAQNNASAAQSAVDMARFRVDQTRANLEASRNAFDKSANRLVKGQEEIASTISMLTHWELAKATLDTILPMLGKAVKSFATLHAQFAQMSLFFSKLVSLINDVMKPQIEGFVNKMEKGSLLILGDIKYAVFVRNMVYAQMMGPYKVSMLAQQVTNTYLDVHKDYISGPASKIGSLIEFKEDNTEEARKELIAKLKRAQQVIQAQSKKASQGILDLVAQDQMRYKSLIDGRLAEIKVELKAHLPEIENPVPKQISDVTESHPERVMKQKKAMDEGNPPFKGNLL